MKSRLSWAGLTLLMAACRAGADQAVHAPEVVPVATPLVGAFFEREYVAEVQAIQYVELRARLKGFIDAVNVDDGQEVKAGQLLFSISARELQQEVKKARAAVDSAAAELEAAQLDHENVKLLFEKNVVAQAEYSVAKTRGAALTAKLEEARAHEGQAAINLSYGQVRAPFDGAINRIPRKVGSAVAEDDLLTTLTNTSEVFAYFRISEAEYLRWTAVSEAERPTTVALRLIDGSLYPSLGKIDAVESELDRDTGNIAFRARFPNEGRRLKHGASGKIVIRTDDPNALVVPQRSTFEVQENLYVYTVDAEETVRARRIIPRARLKDAFVIASGLQPDERFIVEGVQKVKEGDRITARLEGRQGSSL